jgi:hypothetical protein
MAPVSAAVAAAVTSETRMVLAAELPWQRWMRA